MTQLLHLAAAEDHEAAAQLHRIAAALAGQGKAMACGEVAARAGTLARAAERKSAFAAEKSETPARTARMALDAAANPAGPPVAAARPLEAPRESLGVIVKERSPRRRSRAWIVI